MDMLVHVIGEMTVAPRNMLTSDKMTDLTEGTEDMMTEENSEKVEEITETGDMKRI